MRKEAGTIITWSVEKKSLINSLSRVRDDILMTNDGHKVNEGRER
jgi:hypothetical protein